MKKKLSLLFAFAMLCACGRVIPQEEDVPQEPPVVLQKEVESLEEKETETVQEKPVSPPKEVLPSEQIPESQPEVPVLQELPVPSQPAFEYFDTKMLDGLYNFGRATLVTGGIFETENVDGAALFVDELKEILDSKKIITLNEQQLLENHKNVPYDTSGAHVHYWAQIIAGNFEPHLWFYEDYFEVNYDDNIIYVELDGAAKQAVEDLIISYHNSFDYNSALDPLKPNIITG